METTTLVMNCKLCDECVIREWQDTLRDGGYTEEELNRLAEALFEATQKEFRKILPEGCWWHPRASEILGPKDLRKKLQDSWEDLLTEALDAVTAQMAQIEDEVLTGSE